MVTLRGRPLRRPAREIMLFAVRLLRSIWHVRRSATPPADFDHVVRTHPWLDRLIRRSPILLFFVVFAVAIQMIAENMVDCKRVLYIYMRKMFTCAGPRT